MTQESKRHDPDTAELPARNQCGTQNPEEDSPPRKRKSSRKHLNNLNAKEWIKFTKSWFILSGKYGYPSAYATNNFHHYCLTFRKTE